MSYQPIGERHAIEEVSFTILFDRELDQEDIGRITSQRDKWRAFLPKEDRVSVFAFAFGPTPPPNSPVEPVAFSRIKVDGSIAWRLLFDPSQITINCTSYTRWLDVWGIAKQLFADAILGLNPTNRKIKGFAYNVTDAFIWSVDGDGCRIDELVKRESRFRPAVADQYGALWHIHTGYFEDCEFKKADFLNRCRMLNRLHLDAVTRDGRYRTNIVHSLRLDLLDQAALSELQDRKDTDYLDEIFTEMHEKNKAAMTDLLVDDLQMRIGLNA